MAGILMRPTESHFTQSDPAFTREKHKTLLHSIAVKHFPWTNDVVYPFPEGKYYKNKYTYKKNKWMNKLIG